MPVYLRPPQHNPGGPDGQGWNRLSLGPGLGIGDECALRPTDYTHFFESLDTRRARWGGYGHCVRPDPWSEFGSLRMPDCSTCPVFTRRETLRAFGDRILVRVDPNHRHHAYAHLMNRPDKGWAESSRPWTWEELRALEGWRVGKLTRDEHSTCFWLYRAGTSPDEPDPAAAVSSAERTHA